MNEKTLSHHITTLTKYLKLYLKRKREVGCQVKNRDNIIYSYKSISLIKILEKV